MSKEGVQLVAGVFSQIQQTRMELLRLGCGTGHPPSHIDMVDICLGQLLHTMSEAGKNRFAELTMGKVDGENPVTD